MARIIQTILPAGQSGAGFTAANALSVFQANSALEYISSVRLTATEVAGFQFTNLNTTLYSGFYIDSQRLSFGSSQGAAQVQWTIQLLYGSGSTDSTSSYNTDYQRFGYPTYSGVQSGQTYWGNQIGYGGHPSPCDFTMNLNIVPNAAGGNLDANMVMILGGGKIGGYGAQSGVFTGVHTYAYPLTNGIRFASNAWFRAITSDAQINIYGKRVR